MTASVVQSKIQLAPSSGTSGSVTLDSSPTSGNILLFIQTVDKSAGTFTPPSGFSATTNIPASNSSISLWVGTKTSDGSESGAITCTWTNGNNWQTAIVEITGTGTFAVDVSQSNITASAVTTLSSGTTATAGANTGFGIAIFTNDSSGSASTETYTNGFTTFNSSENVGGNPGLWLASGSVTPSATAKTTISALNSDQIAAAIVTFSDVAGGGVTPIPPKLHNIGNQFSVITAHRLNGVLE